MPEITRTSTIQKSIEAFDPFSRKCSNNLENGYGKRVFKRSLRPVFEKWTPFSLELRVENVKYSFSQVENETEQFHWKSHEEEE
jgi:hypothetical protein